MTDERYMKEALLLAQKAAKHGDTPIGCVIVYKDKIIGRGYNRRNALKSTLEHAEITAIKQASRHIRDWRLEEAVLYVTLEPCPMCAGAIVQARVPRVVIGAMNPKAGCAGSILNVLQESRFNHQCEVISGVLEEESRTLLQQFFLEVRKKASSERKNNVQKRRRVQSQKEED